MTGHSPKIYLILLLILFSSICYCQFKMRHPSNVRYIASGYENKSPYFNSLESALNDVYSSVSAENPYVFWIDGDTSLIKDWKHGIVKGRMAMADSIEIYYVAAGLIKWAGFVSGGRGFGHTLPILFNPDDRTEFYGYPKWRYDVYPPWYDYFSKGLDSIDEDMHDLIVYTDTSWIFIRNDTLKFREDKVTEMLKGRNAYTGTSSSDTILIEGASVNDIYFVLPIGPCPQCSSNDVLRAEAVSNKLIVWRNTNGTPNLQYYWMRVRP